MSTLRIFWKTRRFWYFWGKITATLSLFLILLIPVWWRTGYLFALFFYPPFVLFLYFSWFIAEFLQKQEIKLDLSELKKTKTKKSLLSRLFLNTEFGNFLRRHTSFKKEYLTNLSLDKQKPSFSEIPDLLEALLSDLELFSFWEKVGVKKGEGEYLWVWYLLEREQKRRKWWSRDSLGILGSPILEFVAGQSSFLSIFSRDLVARAFSQRVEKLWGRKEHYLQLLRGLREKGRVFLMGEPGTGKKTLLYKLVRDSYSGNLKGFEELEHRRFVWLSTDRILALPKEDREPVFSRILKEAKTFGVILFISDLSLLLSSELKTVFVENVEKEKIEFIATLTPFEKSKFSFEFPTLFSGGVVIKTEELSFKNALLVLVERAVLFERKTGKRVLWSSLREAVFLSARYLPQIPFPQKAVDVFDTAFKRSGKILEPHFVRQIVQEKVKIPIAQVEEKEKQILLNLESLLHTRVVNQERAISVIANSLRRARSGVSIRKGPMGAFLFLGPTGVGKTETAKALSEIYFGSEDKMVRIDMSEFQKKDSIDRLIGTEQEEGRLSLAIRHNPFCVVLLDEIEKAHPDILNLFLQVLDEGYFTDGKGRKIHFHNTILIATSNAGYHVILESLKKKRDWDKVKEKILEYVFAEGVFRPEFINRFDEVVVFQPLREEELFKIAGLMLKKLAKKLEDKYIKMEITPELQKEIAKLGFDIRFGAREMRRVIQEKIENNISKAILSGELKAGDRVRIKVPSFDLEISSL